MLSAVGFYAAALKEEPNHNFEPPRQKPFACADPFIEASPARKASTLAYDRAFDFYEVFRPFAVRLRPNQRTGDFFEDEVAIFADIIRRAAPIRIDSNWALWFGAIMLNMRANDRRGSVTWIMFVPGCLHEKQ